MLFRSFGVEGAQVHARIDRLLLRLGLLVDDGELEETDDAQTLMQLASLSGRVALGERAGKRPRALVGADRDFRRVRGLRVDNFLQRAEGNPRPEPGGVR